LIKNFVIESSVQQILYATRTWDQFFQNFLYLENIDSTPAPTVADLPQGIPPALAEEPQAFSKWDLPARTHVAPSAPSLNTQVNAKLAEIEVLVSDIRLLLLQSER
jgi:hypothetical protein